VYFRRQVVLGDRYIVDLFAPAIGLVVEIDGRSHELRRSTDERRDRRLRALGYRVLRVPAEVVLGDVEGAVERVREAVGELRG
jgi:histidinol dehydrogenase/leucyl-tRNA synthetase/ATP-dependent DNA helicase RecG